MAVNEDLNREYMFASDAARYLQTTERKISLYRRKGLLKYGKLGKNYVFKKSWLDEFMEQWSGYDLSNESKIKYAINAQKWKDSHA